jgi:Xaa-Pro dipeptidase
MMKLQVVGFGVSIPFFFVTSGIRTLADIFKDCQHFCTEVGFPEEWRLRHQRGMTGYASREIIATPKTHQEIKVGQAFAWNPSIKGTKAEETFVLTESGPEVITRVPGKERS